MFVRWRNLRGVWRTLQMEGHWLLVLKMVRVTVCGLNCNKVFPIKVPLLREFWSVLRSFESLKSQTVTFRNYLHEVNSKIRDKRYFGCEGLCFILVYFYGLEIIFSEANNGITKNTVCNRVAHGLIVRCFLRFWQRKEAAPASHRDTTGIPNSKLYFWGLWELQGALKDLRMFLFCFTGSFQVVDSTTLDDIVGFHHRKEEISDIKFSPGKWQFINYFELKFQIKFTFWRQKWLHRSTNRFAVFFFSLESDD